MMPVLVNLARPPGEVDAVEFARAAAEAGLNGVGLADSPRLFPDPFVETTRILASSNDILAGPCVLSLPLLHPARAAGALATLAGHFPDRVVAVVGRGESSLINEGLRAPSLAEYGAMLAGLRERVPATAALRLLGAASGPRTIELTARELGGVLVDVGTTHRAVAAATAHARAARPGTTVWAFVRVAVVDDPAQGMNAGASLLGSCAARMAAAPDWYDVDPSLAAELRELAAAHDYSQHGTAAALSGTPTQAAAALVRDRFIVADRPEDIATRFRELAETGITGVILAGGLPGVTTRLRELGAAVTAEEHLA
jgi:alkanesulfonate monooxygenase SsuD/methylene tetrahydromethanopterin reductase-like flavin-dependent oxidoreductase (luciferase family)